MERRNLEFIKANVGHARLWPKKNTFNYRVYYVKIPIQQVMPKTPRLFSYNKWNVLSMFQKDHGKKANNATWYEYITSELREANVVVGHDYKIFLIAHPRIFGYAFNPISFWVIVDRESKLRAVLCEVHNTFKQTHNYLLTKLDGSPIMPNDILVADKKLYVSPFNKIEGYYEFSFSYDPEHFESTINYFDKPNRQVINTYVGGESQKLSSSKIVNLVFTYPLMTIMVVVRIHWQAIRLYLKKVRGTLKFKPKKYKNNRTTIGKKGR